MSQLIFYVRKRMNARCTYLEMVVAAGMCCVTGSNWKFLSTIG